MLLADLHALQDIKEIILCCWRTEGAPPHSLCAKGC